MKTIESNDLTDSVKYLVKSSKFNEDEINLVSDRLSLEIKNSNSKLDAHKALIHLDTFDLNMVGDNYLDFEVNRYCCCLSRFIDYTYARKIMSELEARDLIFARQEDYYKEGIPVQKEIVNDTKLEEFIRNPIAKDIIIDFIYERMPSSMKEEDKELSVMEYIKLLCKK